jgi:hypothetical protein
MSAPDRNGGGAQHAAQEPAAAAGRTTAITDHGGVQHPVGWFVKRWAAGGGPAARCSLGQRAAPPAASLAISCWGSQRLGRVG